MPTLDATIIPPGTPATIIANTVRDVGRLWHSDLILVRSDGGRERSRYYRGGNSHNIPTVAALAAELSSAGRAVILMEPTDRFSNWFTRNLLLVRDGSFVIEILGPGYDVSDLNRGGVPPRYVVSGSVRSWEVYEPLWWSDIKCQDFVDLEPVRRHLRLLNIGASILPDKKIAEGTDPVAEATRWLQSEGNTLLEQEWNWTFSLSVVQRWVDDAFKVARMMSESRDWKTLVLSGSVLPNRRLVYWDVADGARKWEMPATARRTGQTA